jgi:hypothetical protein
MPLGGDRSARPGLVLGPPSASAPNEAPAERLPSGFGKPELKPEPAARPTWDTGNSGFPRGLGATGASDSGLR